jgi:hypothetical protein
MRRKDLAEMSRRLEEVVFIAERGYEPVFDETLGEWMWVKCHDSSLLSRQEALEQIRKEEESRRPSPW